MKRSYHLLTLFFLLTFATAQAQVKVGANPGSLTTGAVLDAEGSSGARTVILNDGRMGVNTPTPHTSAELELGSTTKALYLNRVANTAAITAPQPGMVIYDLSANCVRVYQGSPAAWSPCLIGAGGSGSANTAPSNPAGTGSFSGRMCFDIAESNDNANNCGALSGRTPNRANFNLPATNTQTYVFTPTGTGTVSNVRFVYVNTSSVPVIQSLTPVTSYTGTLSSGSSASVVAAYNQDLSSDNPSSPSNGLALGRTSSNALTADIYVIYNDGSGDKQLKLTANVKDCACCGAYVAPGVWKEFMCHNLGADYTADPFTPAAAIHGAKYQWGSNGASTSKEGNSLVTWITQAYDQNQSYNNTDITNLNTNPNFADNHWNAGTESAPVKSVNDPCPTGYRVPTLAEWQGVKNNNSYTVLGIFQNSPTNFGVVGRLGPLLVLPIAGYRGASNVNGSNPGGTYYNFSWLSSRGWEGIHWATLKGNNTCTGTGCTLFSSGLHISSAGVQAYAGAVIRLGGSPVRCIQE